MRLKHIVAVAALAMVAVGGAQAKEWKKIRMGTEGAYPPFNYTTSAGELVGFDIEIGNALCEEMKVECEWVTQDWDGIIPGLIAGKYDTILASMSITPEREEKISFSEKYYNTPPAIAVRKDSDLKGVTPADLAGKKIGAQSSTTHSIYAEQTFTDSDIVLYPTSEEYKLDLESGRVDAVGDDVMVLQGWIDSDEGSCCKILGTLKSVDEIHGKGAGIGVRKGDEDLAAMFSDAIAAIRANGKYKEINDKYFAFDAYGE
ncbi:transporter substrate-binding domain-containing protein [Rhodobacteraceae bacterium RKSG542]|uniref:ABC transporter substrate-binding protein n=1 Tax=Pseudovibrio flavus TaxID=2529854 RepID=UPI0012BB9961|nr:ABC transporter substrate-binding protein [Pseudovibrio flavus]MTI16975.1 transporter substrate-binding domain-containing protein [Pseudovibrio flavus]